MTEVERFICLVPSFCSVGAKKPEYIGQPCHQDYNIVCIVSFLVVNNIELPRTFLADLFRVAIGNDLCSRVLKLNPAHFDVSFK